MLRFVNNLIRQLLSASQATGSLPPNRLWASVCQRFSKSTSPGTQFSTDFMFRLIPAWTQFAGTHYRVWELRLEPLQPASWLISISLQKDPILRCLNCTVGPICTSDCFDGQNHTWLPVPLDGFKGCNVVLVCLQNISAISGTCRYDSVPYSLLEVHQELPRWSW